MTDIEAKALALVNEVQADWNYLLGSLAFKRDRDVFSEALCRAIERHEAFKQEVSDALLEYYGGYHNASGEPLERFLIPAPKPDPLVEVLCGCLWSELGWAISPKDIRKALEARGLEIRSKNDD
jgi:hypothetical protein